MIVGAASERVVDGRALREALTAAAREHEGNETATRSAAKTIFKDALASGRAVVRARLEAGAGGLETARALSGVADEVVSALFDFTTIHVYRASNLTEGERLSVCAVGGYGRGELAPFSDLDLLFLSGWKLTPWSESVIEYMLYMLWDLGLTVGHSVRTVDQAIKFAKKDWTILTAMLDLRRIAGDAEHPEVLSGRLAKDVLRGKARDFVAAKLEERDVRLERQGASRYMVEPDVKEGKGALRDLHVLDWLARGVAMGRGGSAAAARLFASDEARRFEAAADFFWRVRALMHFAAGRAHDKLTFDLQPEIARLMGYEDKGAELAVERFMRRYFLVAKDVGALTRILCAKLEAEEAKRAPPSLARLWPMKKKLKGLDPKLFKLDADRLNFVQAAVVSRSPAAAMELFRTAATHGLDVHPDALSAVARSLDTVDKSARSDETAVEAFFGVLGETRTVEPTLRLMNESGLLGAFVPEFGGIVGRTQFNMYHHFTVDEHTLRVVGGLADLEAERLGEDSEFAKPLFKKIKNRRALYLAALLHDTGKGAGDQQIEGAKKAATAAKRLGLSKSEAKLTSWLVGNHLEMNDVAQRRDLGDPRTLVDFIELVETPERLRLLTLLTIADISAVGPGVWTAWKRRLLFDLYDLGEAAIRGGRATAERARDSLAAKAEEARAALAAAASDEERAATADWAARMDDAYFLAFGGDAHARHADFAMAADALGRTADVDAVWAPESGVAELLVLAPDEHGLFARLARAVTAAGGDIRGAHAFTSKEGVAFDVFLVSLKGGREAGEDWGALARLRDTVLAAALGEPIDIAAPKHKASRRSAAFAVEPTVAIDNDASDEASVIEVSGRDRPGLLADLADVFLAAKASVLSAHVESYGERVMDVFYVCEIDGGKLQHPSRRAAVTRKLMAALGAQEPDAPSAGDRKLARAKASAAR